MAKNQFLNFFTTSKACPQCKGRLVTATPLTHTHMQGLLQRLGVTCYCVLCNRRYRATSWLKFTWIGWMGSLARWIWWKTTSLELTLEPEEIGT